MVSVESSASSNGLTNQSRPCWVPFLVVAAVALFAHGLSLRADFYMDDTPHILNRTDVEEGVGIPQSFRSRHLTYGIWHLIDRVAPESSVAYHALNLALHLGLAALFLAVARQFLALHPSLSPDQGRTVAFWGAVLFACHPLCSEPVNYAAQTTILLASLLAMTSVFFFLHGLRSKKFLSFLLCGFAWLLASHAKEPGFFHTGINLFFLIAFAVGVPQELIKANRKLRLGVLITVGCLALFFIGNWLLPLISQMRDGSRYMDHALTQGRILPDYLWRVLLPIQLSSDHYLTWTTSFQDIRATAGLLGGTVGGLALFYFVLVKRSWLATLISLGMFHLLVRFAYVVDELMVEYRTYPAMPWFALLLAYGIVRLVQAKVAQEKRPAALKIAFTAITLLFISLSAVRSTTWSDEDRLALNVLRKYPLNLRALSIHFKHKSERGEYVELASMKDVPQAVAMEAEKLNAANPRRQYSAHKNYVNYIACQYFVLKAMIQNGEAEEALRRSDILLVDVLKKAPTKNHVSVFTVLLAKLLCHKALGQDEMIEQTLEVVKSHYDDYEKMEKHLVNEIHTLALYDKSEE